MKIDRSLVEWIATGLRIRSGNIKSRSCVITGDMFSRDQWEVILMQFASNQNGHFHEFQLLQLKSILTDESEVMTASEFDSYISRFFSGWDWLLQLQKSQNE